MKILITGAYGMLGYDLCQILEKKHNIIKPNSKILNIINFKETKDFIKNHKPDILINCAAYTDVEKAQTELKKAQEVNFLGCENLSKICAENKIPLIHFSSDYVFDGKKNSPYLINDIPNPINNYGSTKLQGENAIIKNCEKYYIIRTSWLFGKNGNNFIKKIIALYDTQKSETPTIKVVDDEISCPTYTKDLSNSILELLDKPYGIYHITNNGFCSRYEFAKKIFNILNLKVNLIPIKSNDYKALAKRPKYSVLKSNFKLRNWSDALIEYLKE